MKTVAKKLGTASEMTQVAVTCFSLWMLCALLIMIK